jgi:MFS family permease
VPFPHGLRALNHRDFRLFWTGQLVSLVGTWMQAVSQAWLVLVLTNSPFRLGLISTLQFAPMLVLSPVAGAITDRLPKRRLIIATQAAMLCQALGLAILTLSGHIRYWHIAVLATLYGVVNTMDVPARQSFIVEMTSKRDLLNAIALNSAVFNGARVVGPATAGLLIGRFGVGVAFLLNSVSFLAVIAALLGVRAQGLPRARSGGSMRAEILEGVAYAIRTPSVKLILCLLFVVSVFLLNYNVVVPLLARQVLHEGAEGFGLLMAAVGLGAVGGASTLAGLGRSRPPVGVLVSAATVLGLGTVSLSAVRHFWVAAAVLLVMGFSGIIFMAGANTALQVTVPDELRGRMMSLYMLVFAGVTPIGSLQLGSITDAFGVPVGCLVSGGLGLLGIWGLAGWWRARHTDDYSLAEARPPL